MKKLLLLSLVCATTAAFAQSGNQAPTQPDKSPVQDLNQNHEPPMLGLHWSQGFEPNARAAQSRTARNSSPLMTNHGGKIMPTATTQAIFWGTSWGSYSGDKITGIDSWYQGHSGSNYAKTVDEYSGTNGQVTATNTHLGHIVDTSASAGGGSTSVILNEVCKVIGTPDASGNGYYAVYTDTPRGSAGYCAYHSYGTCAGTLVQFAYFFKLDGDAGCDPNDTSGLHSQGLAAIANVSAHELSEARSDPASPGAWFDSSGKENGDKCAWTFGAPLVTLTNNTQWKLQGEWSNAAYTAGTGYPNSSGQNGCLSGL